MSSILLWDFVSVLVHLLQCNIPFQHLFYLSTGEMYIGGLRSRKNAVDRCLTDPGTGDLPFIEQCNEAVKKGLNMHWDFKQVGEFLFSYISMASFVLREPKNALHARGHIFIWGSPSCRICRCSARSQADVNGNSRCSTPNGSGPRYLKLRFILHFPNKTASLLRDNTAGETQILMVSCWDQDFLRSRTLAVELLLRAGQSGTKSDGVQYKVIWESLQPGQTIFTKTKTALHKQSHTPLPQRNTFWFEFLNFVQ